MRSRLIARDGPLSRQLLRVAASESTVSSVCGYCSTGCSLDIRLRDGVATTLVPSPSYPVNGGAACPKGWEALTPLGAHDRASSPLVRARSGKLEPVDWGTALRFVADGFRSVQQRHGVDALAWLGTGQLPTEELALLGSVAKLGMGFVHGDGNTRQCMATSVVAHKQSFGFDAPPYTYADLEQSDVVVLIGSNLAIAHPILWQRLHRNPDKTLIVIDPRRTETAMAADHHVALAPKSDLVLLYGLGHLLVRFGYVDHDFVDRSTVGFDDYCAHVAAFPPAMVAEATGIAVEELERIAHLIGRAERASLWWTMGVNQGHQAVRTAQAIIDLALITGNIGRPGTGANSITGQCNAMGSRLFSNTVSLLGGRDFTSASDRSDVASILHIDAGRIPDRNSLAYDQIIEGIHRGTIKALWVVATNSAHSWIERSFLEQVRGNLDLLVVQDMYATTETAQLADVVLPAAGWGEKDGTFINSERRIGRIRAVRRAPGEARSDFWIVRALAETWGCGPMFERWSSPEATFSLLRELSRGRPCDFTGVRGYDHLDAAGGIQWPFPEGADEEPETERRLFGDGRFFHEDGRARIIVDEVAPVPEPAGGRYPFVLMTGRGSSAEWHTGTRTGKSAMLRSLAPSELHVEVSPADAAAMGIAADDWVVVRSRRGEVRARAFVTPNVQPGQVFLPMHDAATNLLTLARFDPLSRQPAYKHCAVSITPAATAGPR